MNPQLADRDAQIAEILEQLLAQVEAGASPDLEAFIRQHPELADELRELWATIQIAEHLAKSSLSLDTPTLVPGASSLAGDCARLEFSDYELLEELGRGGMGIVYKARQKSLDRIVALKMILRGDLASPADVARFRSEAEAAAQLNHPHIVPVYEVGEHEGRPYFSMQLISGTTLARRLVDGPLPSRLAAEMLVPVCRAVAMAHRHGVLHRDLKPSNILIDDDGRTYVTDFGLAKRVSPSEIDSGPSQSLRPGHPEKDLRREHDPLTQSGAILGTPSYMAPEQAAGQRGTVGAASDIYSLGAILYALLAGRPPFQAPSPVDTVLMVLEQDPLPPRMLNPKADADLEMIALKCLQKPADLRYADADALADDLVAYLHNEPISARSSQFSQIITRAFRETHHAAVLENWGLLWMWHSLVVLLLCVLTNVMQASGVTHRWPYIALWSLGVGAWAAIFWELRRRSGPITFVERQIAHVWAGSTIASTLLFFIEQGLDLPALTLSPALALIAGNVFLMKAGILSGKFYLQAVALYLTAFAMAGLQRLPPHWNFGLTLFGTVLAVSFFLPGWKYYRLVRSGSE
ncbi:MAG: serine/threonine-protein kinase [Planctomycetaceae bacterium]